MMDDDESSSCSVMSPSLDGTTTSNTNTITISPDDPMSVKVPAENDVLCGRGGSINSHPGNERFRTLVEKRKRVYLTARFKREKRLIASSIVSEIRAINGRFLQRDPKSGLWKDIGDEKARDKTSQALRENAPSIRAEIEDEINEHHHRNNTAHTTTPYHDPHHHQHPHHMQHDRMVSPITSGHYAPPPPPPSHYGWYQPPYYGYPTPQAPPPPPHHHHDPHSHHPYPNQPPIVGYPPSAPISSSSANHNYHPYATAQTTSTSSSSRPTTKRSNSNSMIDLTADLVTSGAEAIKTWTSKASLSFSGNASVASGGTSSSNYNRSKQHSTNHHHHHSDNMTVGTGTSSQPISYKHNMDEQRRKMVKFRDDSNNSDKAKHRHRTQQQQSGSYHHSTNASATSSIHTFDDDEYNEGGDEDLEPQAVDVATNASLMSQVANHILGSFGSWQMEAGTTNICGGTGSIFPSVFHEEDENKPSMPAAHPSEYTQDTEMNHVEWEGQEVQLVVDDRRSDDVRMPPPLPVVTATNHHHNHHHPRASGGNSSQAGTSLAFSSLGSCHSWLPEQMAAASSYFTGRTDPDDDDDIMMMDHMTADYNSAVGGSLQTHNAENYSVTNDSIGGASLTKVFDQHHPHHHHHHQQQHHSYHSNQHQHHSNQMQQQHHHQMANAMPSPTFSHRELHQIPSWERSVRSKSPLSLQSFNEDDDHSLISKTSSKGALSSVPSIGNNSIHNNNGDEMTWTRE